jgi:biotin carboxylase
VVAVVQDLLTRHHIVGILAAGELLVEPAGLVADALGFPSPGLRATRVARSKYLQRFYLSDWSPVTVTLPPAARDAARLEGLGWPAVLKPSGRRSSSGVHQVADIAELSARYGDYSDQEVLLVEHLVRGSEYSVETLVQEGRDRLRVGYREGHQRADVH